MRNIERKYTTKKLVSEKVEKELRKIKELDAKYSKRNSAQETFFPVLILLYATDGYRNYIGSMAGEMFQLSIFGMVILSASSANRAADVAKEAVMSLPGRIPEYHNELKVILRKECKQNVCLTLWKIYKIDKSLIISALGVLMSYGFLIATFGTISSHTDNII
ncbi:uncharacterized protein TNIN_334731 [Trichonephila inaurata madagascariensis]|uniref:Uncharacterized protein n=1 Tax=Trichonephila inaurata madagascariensis TaxID=2747483 RepID=A0A8X7CEQ8_9ARAC|nr:uncharacterized protein TNIN_334731 [Trichonephila inaurata madagascariensis]